MLLKHLIREPQAADQKRVQLSAQKQTQLDRFKEAARELECDENEKRFDATVKELAKAGGNKWPEKKD